MPGPSSAVESPCSSLAGLAAFFPAMRSGQFGDMGEAGMRILIDEEEK